MNEDSFTNKETNAFWGNDNLEASKTYHDFFKSNKELILNDIEKDDQREQDL